MGIVLTHCWVSACTLDCHSVEWELTSEDCFLLSSTLLPCSHSTQNCTMPPPGVCCFLFHNLRVTLKYVNVYTYINYKVQSNPRDLRKQMIHWWRHFTLLSVAFPPEWDASLSKILFNSLQVVPTFCLYPFNTPGRRHCESVCPHLILLDRKRNC